MTWTSSQCLDIPGMHTASEANVPRGGKAFWVLAKAAAIQRGTTASLLKSKWSPPAVITDHVVVVSLTRISPRALDDDNLQSALKHVRDGVAEWLGVDDRSPLVRWDYSQIKGAMGVRIEITPEAYVCAHCGGHGWTTR